MSIDPNVHLFAMEACPADTSADRVLELARRLQREINAFAEQELEHDEELRALRGLTDEEKARI